MEPIGIVFIVGTATLGIVAAMRVRAERAARRQAAAEAAPEVASGACPVCKDVALTEAAAGERRCPSCRGCLLSTDRARDLVLAPRGLTPGALSDVGTGQGVAQACPVCAGRMRPVLIDDDVVDVCLHCGALWCDEGELVRLTGASAFGAR